MRISVIFVFFVNMANSFGQSVIQGTVYDENNLKIQQVSVVLKDSASAKIIDYAYTNENGSFVIEVRATGLFNIEFRCLGYETKTVPIEVIDREFKITIVLWEKPMVLNEVIVHADKPISVKDDTISFKTEYFTDGTEQTVEDLLRKIPGLSVSDDGIIKVGHQEVEKLMVDGDDFFGKGYKILSKNMPAYPIEEVEVLRNYSNNRLLKGVEQSNNVALNLKLGEKSKRIWFGNIKAGIGNDSFYEFKGNLMNFGQKNKYYFLTNLNDIGYDATGDIGHLIRPLNSNRSASIGDNQYVNNLLTLSASDLDFKKSRTSFNSVELLSLNAIFNPTEKLKIKTLGFFNWDETEFIRNSVEVVNVNNASFTNTENYELRNEQEIAFGKLDITYNISKTKMLETETKYNNSDFDDGSNLAFNSRPTIEDLRYQNMRFDQKISYTNKFKDKKVFLLTGRFIDETTPQNYSINRFFYEDLFPGSSTANNVKQQSVNQMQYAGFEAHLLDRKQNDDLMELQFGYEYRKDRLSSAFSLFNNGTILENPTGYQVQTTYRVSDLYLKSKYHYKIDDLTLIGKLDVHQLFNRLEYNAVSKNKSPFFINPSIGVEWRVGKNNNLTASYSYNTTSAKILDLYSDFALVGYRSFSEGTGDINQLKSTSVLLKYQLGNWVNRSFATLFVLYGQNHDFYSTNTQIEQYYSKSEKILIEDRVFLSVNSEIDYYFEPIESNLSIDLGYGKGEFKNIVNNSNLREVTSSNYSYGLGLRSGFKGVFNYHIGTKWTINKIATTIDNSYTNNVTFLDLSFIFNDTFEVQVQSERYFFGNFNTDNAYYFLGFDARYEFMKSKFALGVTGKNLFNRKRFRDFSISDIGTSTTEYRLLPRFVLLKAEYRF